MPDFTMCINNECPMASRCYRYTAKPDPEHQSFQKFYPDTIKNGALHLTLCDHHKTEPKHKKTQLQTTSKQITTMRTQEEIIKRIGEVKDLLNIQKSDLGAYLEWENLKSFVQPEIVNDVESGKIVRKQLTDPKEEILDYLPFAFKKVKEKNGLSCVRSLYHFKSWIWLDDPAFYEAIVKDIETPSEDFGKAPLKKIAKHYGYKIKRE